MIKRLCLLLFFLSTSVLADDDLRYSTTFGNIEDDGFLFITDQKTGLVRVCSISGKYLPSTFGCYQWVDLITVRNPDKRYEKIESPEGK